MLGANPNLPIVKDMQRITVRLDKDYRIKTFVGNVLMAKAGLIKWVSTKYSSGISLYNVLIKISKHNAIIKYIGGIAMSKLGFEKREFLFDIIEIVLGKINTTENYYRESLQSLDDYEYICNVCLEIFERNLKYKNSNYRSEKEIGEKVYRYLIELKDWLNDLLEE